MPGLIHVPDPDLILLRVEIFFLSRYGAGLTNLKAIINPVVSRKCRCEDKPSAETSAAALLQEPWVDVGRIDEEVRPHGLPVRPLRQFAEILFQFRLGVAPGEIRIGLGEAQLRQPSHDFWACERLCKKDRVRVSGPNVTD